MPFLSDSDIVTWVDSVKIPGTITVETGLESVAVETVFGRLAGTFDVRLWQDSATTPRLIVKVLAMTYVAYLYQRTYSMDEDLSNYAAFLLAQSEALIQGILDYSIVLDDASGEPIGNAAEGRAPIFYPNDASSVKDGAKFSMGTIW